MKKIAIHHIILFSLILCGLLVSFIQEKTHFISERALGGYIAKAVPVECTFKSCFNEKFQSQYEAFLKRKLGFHSALVRINSQYQFSLFGKCQAALLVKGENDIIFARQYIDSYLGTDFLGTQKIHDKVKCMERISDTLLKKGITLIMIIAPGKGLFYPEYLPKAELRQKQDSTNYNIYRNELAKTNIKVLDLVPFYLSMKDTSRYSLFSKTGIHWSIYGNVFVGDTIVRFIEKAKKINLPDFHIKSITTSRYAKYSDRDIADALNLIFPIKDNELAYPELQFDSSNHSPDLDVLTIGDSFYWMFIRLGFPTVFRTHTFWFYFHEISPPPSGKGKTDARELDLKEEIEKRDVIILFSNDAKLKDFSWDFLGKAYSVYFR